MWQDNGPQILELIDFPSFYLTTWIMCGLEGPCFSTQILVDTSKFLVKYGLFNHAYIYMWYDQLWWDMDCSGPRWCAFCSYPSLSVRDPLINCGWQVISSYFDEFVSHEWAKISGNITNNLLENSEFVENLNVYKTLCVYTWLDFPSI
jgi:hypothetical protein